MIARAERGDAVRRHRQRIVLKAQAFAAAAVDVVEVGPSVTTPSFMAVADNVEKNSPPMVPLSLGFMAAARDGVAEAVDEAGEPHTERDDVRPAGRARVHVDLGAQVVRVRPVGADHGGRRLAPGCS